MFTFNDVTNKGAEILTQLTFYHKTRFIQPPTSYLSLCGWVKEINPLEDG